MTWQQILLMHILNCYHTDLVPQLPKVSLHPQVSAVFGRSSQVVHHPVTFKSRAAYVALHQLKAYSSTNIYFQFKTHQPSGLLMYNGGKGEGCKTMGYP